MVTFTSPFLRMKMSHNTFNYISKVSLNRVIFGLKILLTLPTLNKYRHTLEQTILRLLLEGSYTNSTGVMGRKKLGCILMVMSTDVVTYHKAFLPIDWSMKCRWSLIMML